MLALLICLNGASARIAQLVERFLGKEKVTSSILVAGSSVIISHNRVIAMNIEQLKKSGKLFKFINTYHSYINYKK